MESDDLGGMIVPPRIASALKDALARGGCQWRVDFWTGKVLDCRYLDEIRSLDDPWPDQPRIVKAN